MSSKISTKPIGVAENIIIFRLEPGKVAYNFAAELPIFQ